MLYERRRGIRMTKQEQAKLLSEFHDGAFEQFEIKGEDIEFQIEIRYLAEVITPSYTYFQIILKHCELFVLTLWDERNSFYEDFHVIGLLLGDKNILSAEVEDNYVGILCRGGYSTPGAYLKILCDSIVVFDGGGRHVTLDELIEISRQSYDPSK